MKKRNRILSLMLVAILVLTLTPTSAHADPPQGVTHLHSWQVVSDTPPTCTADGSKTWKCSLCGETYTETYSALGHAPVELAGKPPTCTEAGLTVGSNCSRCGQVVKAQESIPALGHQWGGGVVTAFPAGLTPGVKTFTCRHDPSHTRTEEIDPLPWVFAMLSGFVIDPSLFDLSNYNIPPLVITEQPQGGAVTRYGDDSLTLHVAASGGIGEYTYEWYGRRDTTLSGLLSGWNFAVSVGKNAPTLEVDSPGRKYYCRITDAVGNTVASNYAVIRAKLSIAKQPDNVNLQSETTDFYCEAADGSGDYTYRWYDHDEGILGEGQSYPAEKEGYYYCIVTDNVTGETAVSEYCEVYSTEPFRLVNITQSCEILPGEDTFVVASFDGGVEEYEIWWDKDGTAIDSVEGRDEQDNVYSRANVDGAGKYTVHGVDSMYATASGSVTITVPKLTIVEQPVDGTIPKGSYTRINVVVAGGEAPYTYILYRNGAEHRRETYKSETNAYRIWDPGEYYYHIEDSKGRMADSNVVTFENEVFRITKQPRSGTIKKPGETLQLTVEAKGGVEPYTYLWSLKIGNTRYKVGESQTYSADKPGEYMCRVVDADGNMIHSKATQVGYTGDEPFITSQPESGILKGGTFYLSCDAVSGSGGELRFDWEVTPIGQRPRWSNVSRRGNSSRSIDADKAGIYRCKVTDTKTGKYTYSNTVKVYEELTCIITYKYVNTSDSRWGDSGELILDIKGGIGPYTVTIYLAHRTFVGGSFFARYMTETWDKEIDHGRSYTVPNWISNVENGVWGHMPAFYYAVITDAVGNEYKTEYVYWGGQPRL